MIELKNIVDFYNLLDKKIKLTEEINKDILNCKKGCSDCCIDEITVFQIEADNIKMHVNQINRDELLNEENKCAFLDIENKCTIYEQRPYVCRTQGLPLKWIEEDEKGNYIEYRDICSINEEKTLVENLNSEDMWLIGPFEETLRNLQLNKYDNLNRIQLKELLR